MNTNNEREIIIATVRGTATEREGLRSAAKREGVSVNRFIRRRLALLCQERRKKEDSEGPPTAHTVETPHGTFVLSQRATWGFSVVLAKRDVWHHRKRLCAGEVAIVEHRKRPYAPQLIGVGWCQHVATYDTNGVLQEYKHTLLGDDTCPTSHKSTATA